LAAIAAFPVNASDAIRTVLAISDLMTHSLFWLRAPVQIGRSQRQGWFEHRRLQIGHPVGVFAAEPKGVRKMAPVKGPFDLHVLLFHVVMRVVRMAHDHVLVMMHPALLVAIDGSANEMAARAAKT
jgi:hypothetical protein